MVLHLCLQIVFPSKKFFPQEISLNLVKKINMCFAKIDKLYFYNNF